MSLSNKLADSADLARGTEWSRRVYGALRDWEVARTGRWSTWEGGVFVLTVDTMPNGAPCEEIRIIASADERVGFYTRKWEAELPEPGQSFDAMIGAVRELARKWFAGEIALAAFYLIDVWQGVLPIDPKRLETEMTTAFNWIAARAAVDRVEVQGPQAANDQKFGLAVNGKPLAAPQPN